LSTVRYDRRDFLAWFFGAVLLRAIGARASAQPLPGFPQARHPESSPGIDPSSMPRRGQVTENPAAAPVFDMVRRIRKTLGQIRAAIDGTFG
jgi:hypothetical protein